MKEGKGFLENKADKYKYDGAFSNDKQNGKGIIMWDDGRKYDGEMKDDKLHGEGIFEWPV